MYIKLEKFITTTCLKMLKGSRGTQANTGAGGGTKQKRHRQKKEDYRWYGRVAIQKGHHNEGRDCWGG